MIFTYAYALIFIHRRFGSLFWLLGVLIGSLFHKKWVLIGSLSQSLGVPISFGGSGLAAVVETRLADLADEDSYSMLVDGLTWVRLVRSRNSSSLV